MDSALLDACLALFKEAFPEDGEEFSRPLFERFAPHLRVIAEDGRPLSMLFSIPYPIKTKEGTLPARYLYAVCTAKEARGRGLATELLKQEIATGAPLFLRPMQDSLFAFYEKAGFTPFSPYRESGGLSATPLGDITITDSAAYGTVREAFLTPPYVAPIPPFLSLSDIFGGGVYREGEFAALFVRDNDTVLFKEWLGDTTLAPHVAATLGATHYRLRTYEKTGSPFGVCANFKEDAKFLLALD